MNIEILGISGNPVRDSNTDRLARAILGSSELEYECVKEKAWSGPLRMGQFIGDRVRAGDLGSERFIRGKVPFWRVPRLLF